MADSDPSHPEDPAEAFVTELMRQAVSDHTAGHGLSAEAKYRRALAADPDHAGAMHGLGVLAFQSGRLAEALELIRGAIERQPASAEYWNNLGMALRRAGKLP